MTLEGDIEPSSMRPDEASVAFPRWRVTGHEAAVWPVAAISAVRAWSLANIERSFPEPHAALASGILTGEQGPSPPASETHSESPARRIWSSYPGTRVI